MCLVDAYHCPLMDRVGSDQKSIISPPQQGSRCASYLESLCGSSSGNLIFHNINKCIQSPIQSLLCCAAQAKILVLLKMAIWNSITQMYKLPMEPTVKAN